MAMSCSRELVRCVCFCAVHSVSMYWHTTPPNGSVGVGVEVGCVLSVRETVCSSHSRQSMQSNPSAGWPSPASTHCCKLCISLVSMFKSAWLLGRMSLRWPSASDPPRAIAVSELFVLSLSSVSGIFYMGIKVSVFTCMAHSYVVSGNSVGFICSAVWLVSVSNFLEHGFEWWTCLISSFVVVACHVQSGSCK